MMTGTKLGYINLAHWYICVKRCMIGNIYERFMKNTSDRKTHWGLSPLNKHGILALRMGQRHMPNKSYEIKVNSNF